MKKALVLTNGMYQSSDAKTAHGLVRSSEQFLIAGIIDHAETANKDAGELLDGKHRNIPIYANLATALKWVPDATTLIIGVATVGGKLPADMLVIIKSAIANGLSIVNGLHDYLNDHPDLVALAKQNNISLTDIRKPKKREDLHFFTGDIFNIKTPIVAVIGMDCAMGKRTTARMLMQACAKENIKAEMIYTGQTGWLQGSKYGFVFDSTLNDFVSGELENAILTCNKEVSPDIIFLEGQSALRNPSGPCGLELLISGNAKYVVLLFAPKRVYFDNEAHWGKIPSVESEIAIIEQFGSKVIALAMNTEGCTYEEAIAIQASMQSTLHIPILLPIQEGVAPLIPVLKSLLQ
ncbi:DUF1611 domain-containing protein [Sediminibacterium sp.]|uniref:DUF1611 domain-containing protein n=1 Tax=Sediminibacterium sp. TaxID=1917865 RepID=UPI0027337749|nr:DUF1611 domain-containing protein [Sediminibacterium sp.]MDP3394573.1 DUF1611 domain-containing protein [Sediminibacterium sp.]MDP3568408.1 DUF1611 domain-containing protein [Sediminibacterium sp.]